MDLSRHLRFRAAHEPFAVPALWLSEVANGLVMGERRGRIARKAVEEALALLRGLSFVIDHAPSETVLGPVLAIARQERLTVYDASYLELAIRRHLPLATLDKALGASAGRCGVIMA